MEQRRTVVREVRAAWRPLVLIGLVNSAIPITSISWAETRIDSGLTAVIQASAPLFTALLALRFSRAEIVTGSRLVGLLVGFGGVALLVGAQPSGNVLSGPAVSPGAVARSIELSVSKYCPVHALLSEATRFQHVFRVVSETRGQEPVKEAVGSKQ